MLFSKKRQNLKLSSAANYRWRLRVNMDPFTGSLSCGQTLGMGAGTVEDFQITSSSRYSDYSAVGGRPNGAGWCACPADENPFFQVLRQIQKVFWC